VDSNEPMSDIPDKVEEKPSKIRQFPKAKRETPDEIEPLVLAHTCSETTEGFHWAIQLRHSGLYFVCCTCGLGMTLEEVLTCYEED